MPILQDAPPKLPEDFLPGGREIFRQIAEHSHIGIWLLHANGSNFYGNPAAQRIWGGAKFVGKDQYSEFRAWDAKTGEPLKNEDWAGYKTMITGEPVLDHMLKIQRFDGEFAMILNSAIPVKDTLGNLQMIIILNTDITELKASEAKREELARIVSHDLKNPLHAIQMSASFLHGKIDKLIAEGNIEKIKHYIEMITNSSTLCLGLVKDILNVAGVDKGPFELNRARLPVNELLESLRPIYDPLAAQKGLRLLWNGGVDHAVIADKERVNQVLSNIVGNAIKFTPGGGEIVVSTQKRDDHILFEVCDTGPGIPEEHLKKIFQKSYKVTEGPQGTGLGLYIAQTIVLAHGGSIWADSCPGKGSRFYFTLPTK
ncbi:MAG: ATP-binding protein [Bacteriovoracaceae bacterium]